MMVVQPVTCSVCQQFRVVCLNTVFVFPSGVRNTASVRMVPASAWQAGTVATAHWRAARPTVQAMGRVSWRTMNGCVAVRAPGKAWTAQWSWRLCVTTRRTMTMVSSLFVFSKFLPRFSRLNIDDVVIVLCDNSPRQLCAMCINK